MSLEALQAQAGHASIDSTRIYLYLANDWLLGEYLRAAEAIEAQIDPTATEGGRHRWPGSAATPRLRR